MSFYDPAIGRYVRFGRLNVLSALEKEEAFGIHLKRADDILRYRDGLGESKPVKGEFPDYDDFVEYPEMEDYLHRHLHQVPYEYGRVLRLGSSTGCSRRIVRSESEDFLHWSVPELVIGPNELNTPRFYGMTSRLYEGHYIGLLQVLNSSGNRRAMGNPAAARETRSTSS